MLHITFKFADALSNWEYRHRECWVENVDECIRIYGLNDSDVVYEILNVEEVD